MPRALVGLKDAPSAALTPDIRPDGVAAVTWHTLKWNSDVLFSSFSLTVESDELSERTRFPYTVSMVTGPARDFVGQSEFVVSIVGETDETDDFTLGPVEATSTCSAVRYTRESLGTLRRVLIRHTGSGKVMIQSLSVADGWSGVDWTFENGRWLQGPSPVEFRAVRVIQRIPWCITRTLSVRISRDGGFDSNLTLSLFRQLCAAHGVRVLESTLDLECKLQEENPNMRTALVRRRAVGVLAMKLKRAVPRGRWCFFVQLKIRHLAAAETLSNAAIRSFASAAYSLRVQGHRARIENQEAVSAVSLPLRCRSRQALVEELDRLRLGWPPSTVRAVNIQVFPCGTAADVYLVLDAARMTGWTQWVESRLVLDSMSLRLLAGLHYRRARDAGYRLQSATRRALDRRVLTQRYTLARVGFNAAFRVLFRRRYCEVLGTCRTLTTVAHAGILAQRWKLHRDAGHKLSACLARGNLFRAWRRLRSLILCAVQRRVYLAQLSSGKTIWTSVRRAPSWRQYTSQSCAAKTLVAALARRTRVTVFRAEAVLRRILQMHSLHSKRHIVFPAVFNALHRSIEAFKYHRLRLNFIGLRWATMQLQSCTHRVRDRREFVRQWRAAAKLQTCVRMEQARNHDDNVLTRRYIAARQLQAAVRGHTERCKLGHKVHWSRAATCILAACLRVLDMDKMDRLVDSYRAAMRFCCCVLRRDAQLRFIASLHSHRAASRLEAVLRRALRVRELAQPAELSAAVLQSAFRRCVILRLNAACRLQAAVRFSRVPHFRGVVAAWAVLSNAIQRCLLRRLLINTLVPEVAVLPVKNKNMQEYRAIKDDQLFFMNQSVFEHEADYVYVQPSGFTYSLKSVNRSWTPVLGEKIVHNAVQLSNSVRNVEDLLAEDLPPAVPTDDMGDGSDREQPATTPNTQDGRLDSATGSDREQPAPDTQEGCPDSPPPASESERSADAESERSADAGATSRDGIPFAAGAVERNPSPPPNRSPVQRREAPIRGTRVVLDASVPPPVRVPLSTTLARLGRAPLLLQPKPAAISNDLWLTHVVLNPPTSPRPRRPWLPGSPQANAAMLNAPIRWDTSPTPHSASKGDTWLPVMLGSAGPTHRTRRRRKKKTRSVSALGVHTRSVTSVNSEPTTLFHSLAATDVDSDRDVASVSSSRTTGRGSMKLRKAMALDHDSEVALKALERGTRTASKAKGKGKVTSSLLQDRVHSPKKHAWI